MYEGMFKLIAKGYRESYVFAMRKGLILGI